MQCGHFPIAPQNTNFEILGANSKGPGVRSSNNLSFSFDRITTVNVTLTNVPFNETHFYEESVISVEIEKVRSERKGRIPFW